MNVRVFRKKNILIGIHFVFAIPIVGLSSERVDPLSVNEKNIYTKDAKNECNFLKSTNDIVDCALEFHPTIKRGLLNVSSAEKFEEKEAQVSNPTFSFRHIKGDKNSEGSTELETNLAFTVELGGKRSSRKEYALASKNQILASNEAIRSEIKITTITNLYRLTQVVAEKNIVKEAIQAFLKVMTQLNKLSRLSAEQEVSLSLFEIALEETKINLSEIIEEERKLENYFYISTGHSLAKIYEFSPKFPIEWPNIDMQQGNELSSEIKKLKTLSQLAQKELEIQESDAWPDLKIGPSFSFEKDGALENKMIGFNMEIPIPLFQTNGGGKAYARSELIRVKKNIIFTQSEEKQKRFEQLKIYESAVDVLTKTMNKNTIETKYNRIESLYLRGVVSNSVFLDSLKQKISYLKSRHQRELKAMKALWNIYKYDGKIFEEKI